MSLSARLKRWRVKSGHTQATAAKTVGCSTSYFGFLETGARTDPGNRVAHGIERATKGAIKAAEWLMGAR